MSKLLSKTVTIAQWGRAPLLIYLPLYVALYGGYAKAKGLKPKLIFSGSDENVFHAVARGKADFGISDPIFTEIHRKKTRPGPACKALLVKRVPIWGVTHNPAIPPLKRIEDFVQLRIGSLPRGSTTYSLIEGLKLKHKRLLKYTQIIEAPIEKQFHLLSTGKADVVLELEPYISMAEHQGLRTVFSLAQFYGDFAFTGLTVSHGMQMRDPAVVEKLIAALDKGLKVCREDKKEALRIAIEMFPGYAPEILEKGIRRLRAANVWPDTADVNQAGWKAAVHLRRKIGDL
jgi:NitT/TauT family transport system substrate-binding protein